MRSDVELASDFDIWKYISLTDKDNISLDFIIPNKDHCLKFIIGLSHATMSINTEMFGITNHKLIRSLFVKLKL